MGYFGNDEPDFGASPVVWGSPAPQFPGFGASPYPPGFGQGPLVWGAPQAPAYMQPYAPPYQVMPFAGDPDYAIYGAYEIMGNPAASPAQRALAAAVLTKQAKVVTQQRPTREGAQTLPCTSLTILTTATRDISLQPQRPFRPEKFRASSTHTAPFFVITAYSIGQDNQFVGPGSIPCDLFSEVALYSQISAYTANLGNLITLTVQNIDTNTRDFRAAFFGTSLMQ